MTDPRVAGVVLAAGRSRRMGTPKPLLAVEGVTFLERTIGTLRAGGCDPVLAVLPGVPASGPAGSGPAESGLAGLARRAGARVVVNEAAESEQIDSLRAALAAVPAMAADAGAVLVLPVDHPLVTAATVRAVLAGWRGGPAGIVRAVHAGRPGHPTLFASAVWPELMDPSLPAGARSVVEGGSHRRLDLEVDDPGVTADIDTPAAYGRWIEGS